MATVTLRPNGGTGIGTTTGGTLSAVLSDNLDTTYVTDEGLGYLDLTTFAFPALSQVRSVQPSVRYMDAAGRFLQPLIGVRIGSTNYYVSVPISAGAIVTNTGTTYATNPGTGAAWSQTDIDALIAYLNNSDPNNTGNRAYEVYVAVIYNQAPVATVTVPASASTITNDSTPDVTWTYSDPESDAQERYQLKAFSAAQYGAGGFDPETSAATYSSGEVLSSATTATITTVLANATYRAYVKVADVGSSGRYGAWAFTTFTLNVVPPPVPTLTATADNTLKRVTLTATSTGTPAVEFFDFEFSADGVTWLPVRNGTRVTASASAATVVDYESPPNVARQYRARAGRLV